MLDKEAKENNAMKYRQTALFSDLDSTLFDHRGRVSEANIAAIKEYIAQGGLFGVATGRASYNALKYLSSVPINAPSIVFNGAAVYDYASKSYLAEAGLDKAAVGFIKELAAGERRLDIQIYTDEEICYITPREHAWQPFVDMHMPCSFCRAEDIEDKLWLKAVLISSRPDGGAELEQIKSLIAQRGLEDKLDIVLGTTDILPEAKYFELLPHATNKGSGIELLRTLSPVAGRSIICVGDYWNDLEMLQKADIACAPENGADGVKAAARFITPSNDHDAIAYIIKSIIPQL